VLKTITIGALVAALAFFVGVAVGEYQEEGYLVSNPAAYQAAFANRMPESLKNYWRKLGLVDENGKVDEAGVKRFVAPSSPGEAK
jgi:hypothetical protein